MHALIATHGRSDLLDRTLSSLAKATIPVGFRCIVVENASDCGASDVCLRWNDLFPVEYHFRKEAGKSRALQWAIEERIESGLVVFLDDDIRIAPGTLEAYSKAAASGRGKIFGGPFGVDYEEGGVPPSWLRHYLPPSALGCDPDSEDPLLRKKIFVGFNYALFAEDVIDAGGFNFNIGPGALRAGTEDNPIGQEAEMQARLRSKGFRDIWVPEAKVWHFVPRSRCTPEWTLQRHRRGAMTEASAGRVPACGPNLLGLPRWMWGQYLRSWMVARVGQLSPSEELRFQTRLPLESLKGKMDGLRFVRQRASRLRANPSTIIPLS